MSVKEAFKKISSFLPEVAPPKRKLALRRRLIWTGIVVIIYLIMGEIPLYGVTYGGADPFGFARIIFASRRGTLLELGIGPIVTAGLIMQLLAGAEIIKFDFTDPEERAIFTAATKLLTIIVTIVESMAFVYAGLIRFKQTTPPLSVISVAFLQLVIATLILMLLDEMVQKGWGIGSGISLFIAVGVSQTIFWDIFSPISVGGEPYGIIPYVIYLVASGDNIGKAFIRHANYPSILALIATIIVTILILYAEGIRIELPISYARYRGIRSRYPVKLLYVSNIPVILTSTLMTDIYMISQIIWSRFNTDNNNLLLNLIGMFEYQNQSIRVVGGLAYYITPPSDIFAAAQEPLRAIAFLIFMILFSILFAVLWVEVGGLSAERVSQQLIDAGMQIPGFRRRAYSITILLGRYIPVVTIIGGFFVGLIAGAAQLVGVFGSGMGILLTVDILMNYYQLLMREQIEELYPALSRILKV